MPITYREIIDDYDNSVGETEDGSDSNFLEIAQQIIEKTAIKQHIDFDPTLPQGMDIPDDIPISIARIREMIEEIENALNEKNINDAFTDVLDDNEMEIYIRFTELFDAAENDPKFIPSDTEIKEVVRDHLLPLAENYPAIKAILETFLQNGDINAVMKKIISERGVDIKEAKPGDIKNFVTRFRQKIEHRLSHIAQA